MEIKLKLFGLDNPAYTGKQLGELCCRGALGGRACSDRVMLPLRTPMIMFPHMQDCRPLLIIVASQRPEGLEERSA